jgi:LysM repeat protein
MMRLLPVLLRHRRSLGVGLLLPLFLLLSPTALAQEVRVVDGSTYIVHTVQQGQTLYAISRHYAVPVDAITAANPAATQGLSLGQVLLIPQDAVVKKELKTAPALRNGELVHTVAKKETLFGISRKYGVDQHLLQERNPELAGRLREGMQLVIPTGSITGQAPAVVAPAADDKSTSHLVMPGETLFGLGKQYGVSVEELQAANGGLPQGLKVGSYVRIPAVKAVVTEPEPVASAKSERYAVAFLLPFSIADNDSVLGRDPTRKGYYEVTEAAVQFYAGAQLAIDSLEVLGFTGDVHVLDVGSDAAAWTPELRKAEIRDMDLYIGPFHRGAIEQLIKVSGGAHIVCPVPQTNKILLGNPTVSKVLSARPDQVQALARHAVLRHGADNLILARPDLPAEKELQDQLLRALQEALSLRTDRLRDSVLVARTGKRDINGIINLLQGGKRTVVLVPSEDVEYVSALVSKLVGVAKDKEIIVYGMPGWMDMESVSPVDLDKLHQRFAASSYVDRTDPRVIAFIRNYRERFNDEPREYAFLGFDVTFYYLSALLQEGRGFADHFKEVNTTPLHMDFRMLRTGPENGYRNDSVLILEHREMGLQRVP